MSDVPKRNVERRKAAENSEKKWKEAFEEDEDNDPLQEVLLRSLKLAEAHVNNQVLSDTLLDNTNCNEFEEQENYVADRCNCNRHTLLEDNLLKEIVMSMACPSCYSNEPVLNYSKDKCGRLESICINCCKCQQTIFTRTISDLDLKNIKCTCNLQNRNTDYGDKMTQNESNTNVELLVCDVDVIKQTEVENQEKEDFIEDIIIPTNNDMSDHSGHHQFREGESNEDQMLFDSLPAILSNSNVSIAVGNNGCQIPVLQPKVKRMENFNEGYGDENHYYLWQDITENDLQNHELLPCDALYQPQRKRKPRSEFQYQFWKKEDEKEILNYFTDMIKALKVPGKDACREFLSKNPHIKTDWTRVKYKVYNQIQKHKKKSKSGSDYGV